MKHTHGWLIGILAVDLGLLLTGVFGARFFGPRILSFSAASIGLVTFLGLFTVAYEPGLVIERAMRNAIAGSMIAMYLAVVGMATFFVMINPGDSQTLAPLTKTMIDSFQTVITVVIGFYFASSAIVEGIQRMKTGEAQGADKTENTPKP